MQNAIDETNRRREKQLKYNEKHNITPQQIVKAQRSLLGEMMKEKEKREYYSERLKPEIAADPVVQYMSPEALKKAIENTRKKMEKAASELNFIEAAKYRDEMYELEKILKGKDK